MKRIVAVAFLLGVFAGSFLAAAKAEAPGAREVRGIIKPAVDWERKYYELENFIRVTPQCRRYWVNS